MNIHPVFVHFPIALLTLYALSELLYVKKLRELPFMFYTKAIVVILGALSSFVTLQTGEWAAAQYQASTTLKIIAVHSSWADLTVGVFTLLAASYLVLWLGKYPRLVAWLTQTSYVRPLWRLCTMVAHWCVETPLVVALAAAGLAAITITGALGGSLVYGSEVDPVVSFIYHLVIKP